MSKTEETDQRYFNIALFPNSADCVNTCVELAQANLVEWADEYLLSKNAWPHITLCQFQAASQKLSDIWSSVRLLQSGLLSLRFHHIYIWPGMEEHLGRYWVGLAVVPEASLIRLQKAVYDHLLDLGIRSETAFTTYFPHLTWARCRGNKPTISTMPMQDFWERTYSFSLSLGRSDKNGVYHERLFSATDKDLATISATIT